MDAKDNINTLDSHSFRLTINSEEFDYVQFMCNEVAIPSISLQGIATAFKNFNLNVPGETPQYGTFPISFLVDEELNAYLQLRKWILHNQFNDELKYCDMTLHVLSNQHTVNKKFEFKDSIITDLGEIVFSTQNNGEPLTCTAQFSYSYFDVI